MFGASEIPMTLMPSLQKYSVLDYLLWVATSTIQIHSQYTSEHVYDRI